jgi:hypothetical protein
MSAPTPGQVAAQRVAAGEMTQEQAERALGLAPGERLAANGVVIGSGGHPDVPRYGADETDLDAPAEPWASLYRVADLMDGAGS